MSKAWAETQATKTQKKCPVSPCRLVGGCWREIGWFGSDVPCFGSEEDQESKLGSTCMQAWVSDLRTCGQSVSSEVCRGLPRLPRAFSLSGLLPNTLPQNCNLPSCELEQMDLFRKICKLDADHATVNFSTVAAASPYKDVVHLFLYAVVGRAGSVGRLPLI